MPPNPLSSIIQVLDSPRRALSKRQPRSHSTISRGRKWRNCFRNLFTFNWSNTSEVLPQGVEHVEYAPLTLSLSREDLLDPMEELLRTSLDCISLGVSPPSLPIQTPVQSASKPGLPLRPSHLTIHGESNYLQPPSRSLSTSSLGASASSTPSERPCFMDASSLVETSIYLESDLVTQSPLRDIDGDCTTDLVPRSAASRHRTAILFGLDVLFQELFDYILCLAFGCVDGFELSDLDLLLTRRSRARAVSKQWKLSIDNLVRYQFLAIPKHFLPHDQSQPTNTAEESWIAEILARGATLEAVSFRFCNRFIDSSLGNHPRHSQLLKAAAESTRRLWLYADLQSTTPLPEAEPTERTSSDSSNLRHFTWISPNTGVHSHLPDGCCFPWRNLKEDLPWAHLTHVELICPLSVDDVRFALSQSPNLISLRVTVVWGSNRD